MLDIAWNDTSRNARESMCVGYEVWQSFKKGIDNSDLLNKSEFYDFMDEHC
jgi:hypothetical protein